MRVLMITGDRSFKKGHPRFDIQAGAVEELAVVYWGPDAPFPAIPKGKFDVVTAQDPFFRGLFALYIAKKIDTPLNIQVHADIERQGPLKRFVAPFVLRHADTVRVVSEALKKQVGDLRIRAHITVLPVFVDVERFRAIERKPDAQPTVLWVGRFEDEKDPMLAVTTFKSIHESNHESKMIMLGAGSMEAEVRRAARGLPVEFPGFQDIVPYLARVHVVLSTSRAESWGATIVESLAAGVPVVAPDVGIAREAGAIVVPRTSLSNAVVQTVAVKPEGVLRLRVYPKNEWTEKWRNSLI